MPVGNTLNRALRGGDHHLHADVVGEITDSGKLAVFDGDEPQAAIPVRLLIDEVPLRHPLAIARELQPVAQAGKQPPAAGFPKL